MTWESLQKPVGHRVSCEFDPVLIANTLYIYIYWLAGDDMSVAGCYQLCQVRSHVYTAQSARCFVLRAEPM